MYVRSYSTAPRESSHDGGVATPSHQDTESAPQETPTAPTEQETKLPDTEKKEVPVFGSNGMPRQPLRRRKRKTKPSECGKSPQKEPDTEQCPNIPREPITPLIAPCEGLHPQDTDCEKKQECLKPPLCDRCDGAKPRSPFGCLSSEELLLGGLIILLINEGAGDDVLLILAFLLISGIRFEQ